MTESEARKIAQNHIKEFSKRVKGVTWVVKMAYKVDDGFYFDYTHEVDPTRKPDELPLFCGAPGYLITSEGAVKVISMEALQKLRLQNPDIH